MKEGISYSFLLNIIILFIFVCAAVITGIFSYYRAFRAGTIIINEIEKYEGFNCVSADSISKKLGGVSYNLPFDVKCKDSETNCITDEGKNYKIYSYNVDAKQYPDSIEKIYLGDALSSDTAYYDGASSLCMSGAAYCKMTKKYQYGVYTYMYVNLPVVSSLIKIPIYNKTRIMYDQRRLFTQKIGTEYPFVFDLDVLPLKYSQDYNKYYDIYLKKKEKTDVDFEASSSYNYFDAIRLFASQKVKENYAKRNSGVIYTDELLKYGYGMHSDDEYLNPDYNLREFFKLSEAEVTNGTLLQQIGKKVCGTVVDWSLF